MNQDISSLNWAIIKKKFYIPSIFFLLIGVFLSIYATSHHILLKEKGATQAICNINDFMSCDNIAASAYSEFMQIPLGIWGLGYFLSLLSLLIYFYYSSSNRVYSLALYKFLTICGLCVSLFLGGVSFFVLSSMCLTCIGIYIVNIMLFCFWYFNRKRFVELSFDNFKSLFVVSFLPLVVMSATLVLFHYQILFSSRGLEDNTLVLNTNEQLLSEEKHDIPLSMSPYMGKGEDYRKGKDTASVVLVEFADFECPACRVASQLLKDLKKEFGDELLIVFKNYPLDMKCNENITRVFHKNACLIAQLSRCAGRYGRFWDYHDLAFSKQKQASDKNAIAWAKELGLKEEEINDCLNDKGLLEKIKDDIRIGKESGITGTPSFFINGRRFVGKSRQFIRDEIQKLLSNKS